MDSDSLERALESKAAALHARLLAKVQANLSGDVLQSRSGTLKGSIVADLAADADKIVASIASVGVPYAAIQEHGGHTAPHDIIPVKACALAFAGVAGTAFARRVHHPGSAIPARAPFGAALAALKGEILDGFKKAVRDALGAT